jgi:hypothetical protein
MAITTAAGAKLYIGGTTAIDTTSNETAIADFEDETWVEVAEVEDLGELGDEAADITFTSLGDSRVRHLKGARDAGTRTVVVGDDPLDAGQQDLIDAEATNFEYNFKVELLNAPSELYSNGVEYWRGLVMSKRRAVGTNDNVIRRTFVIGCNTKVYEVAPALLP